jgi:uncharacterized protein YycO
LRLAFYIWSAGTVFDAMIASYDAPKRYSHVELLFSDGWSFSSSIRDGGPRFMPIDYLGGSGPDRHWDFIEFRTTTEQEKTIRDWCKTKVPGHYDLFGVLAFKIPGIRQLTNAYFCSEICVAALQQVGLLKDLVPSKTTPNGLYVAALKQLPI